MAQEDVIKAIVQDRYGSPDVLSSRTSTSRSQKKTRCWCGFAPRPSISATGTSSGASPMRCVRRSGCSSRSTRYRDSIWPGRLKRSAAALKQFQPGDEVFGWCDGAFAEYACAEENNLLAKPSNLTLEQAAAVGDSAFTALNAVRDQGKVQPGQKVVINGASGGVGTFAVQIAKSFGADVTGVCSTRNVDMVRSIGADQVIDYTQEDFAQDRTALRRDARSGGEPFVVGLPPVADPPGHVRLGWGIGYGPLARTRSSDQGALVVTVRATAGAHLHYEAYQGRIWLC